MNTAYQLSISQTAKFIHAIGDKRSIVAQGYSGTGKTSGIKAELKLLRPKNIYVEFDCTNKDIQDMSAPQYVKAVGDMICDYVQFVPNAELGVHLGVPVTINFDELFKAPDPVKKAVRRIMLERMVGTIKLPEGSIIYGTSNLTTEGLGDTLAMHQRNAIIVVKTRKPTTMELLEFGINNDWDSIMLGWIKDNGDTLLQTFEEIKDPADNPYIHHPRNPIQGAVCTPRSLHMGSDILKQRHMFDDQTLAAGLMGAIGDRGGMDLMAYVKIGAQLPTSDSIKNDPMGAIVPTSIAAICMVVFRTLSTIDRSWIDAWMDYLGRLDTEAQAMFVNGVRASGYSRQSIVMTNKKFTQFAKVNNYMFASGIE